MGHNSEILWTEHTFNTHWGCEKVSEGCANCYAESFSKRVGFKIWGQDTERRFFGDKHWAEPLKWNAAAEKLGVMHRVFCGSMCDIFEDRTDLDTHRIRVFRLVAETPNLLWLFLTKRPKSAAQLLPQGWKGSGNWPRNVMVGTTIENQKRLEERLPHVIQLHKQFPDIQTFASCEPLLSELNWENGYTDRLEYFDWIVAGGESGPKARPCHADWARKLRDDCAERTDMGRPWPLAFLWKQWGEYGPTYSRSGYAPVSHSEPRSAYPWGAGVYSPRLGKKAAGHLLDGKEHRDAPRLAYGPQVAELEVTHA